MSRIDPQEVEVWCRQCNGYLYSVGPLEAESACKNPDVSYDPGQRVMLTECPMKKDPMGSCTGIPRF